MRHDKILPIQPPNLKKKRLSSKTDFFQDANSAMYFYQNAATRSHSSGRKWPPQCPASGRKWPLPASGRKWPQVAAFCDFNFHPQSNLPEYLFFKYITDVYGHHPSAGARHTGRPRLSWIGNIADYWGDLIWGILGCIFEKKTIDSMDQGTLQPSIFAETSVLGMFVNGPCLLSTTETRINTSVYQCNSM